MGQTEEVHCTRPVLQDRMEGSFRAILGEIPQKGIAGSQGKKSKSDTVYGFAAREDAVENFMSRAVPADGEKPPVTLIVGLASKLDCVTRTSRGNTVHLHFLFTQTGKRRSGEFRGAAATSSRVDNGEESLHLR